jgi:hypothetical protein
MAFRLLRPEIEVVLTPLYAPDETIAQVVFGHRTDLWAPQLVRQLEREGMPQRRHLFGAMRYVPSVFDFFARREGLRGPSAHEAEDGPENFGIR